MSLVPRLPENSRRQAVAREVAEGLSVARRAPGSYAMAAGRGGRLSRAPRPGALAHGAGAGVLDPPGDASRRSLHVDRDGRGPAVARGHVRPLRIRLRRGRRAGRPLARDGRRPRRPPAPPHDARGRASPACPSFSPVCERIAPPGGAPEDLRRVLALLLPRAPPPAHAQPALRRLDSRTRRRRRRSSSGRAADTRSGSGRACGYGFAWVAHFFVEKNRPATFTYPFYSLASDYVMVWKMLRGKMDKEVSKALAGAALLAGLLATAFPAHSQKSSSRLPPPSSPKQKTFGLLSLAADYLQGVPRALPRRRDVPRRRGARSRVRGPRRQAARLLPGRPARRARRVDGVPGAPREDRREEARRARPHRRGRDGARSSRSSSATSTGACTRRRSTCSSRSRSGAVEFTLQGMTPGAGGARGTAAEWRSVALRAAAVPAYLKTALANVRRGASGNAIPDRRLIAAAVDAAESTAVYFEKSLPEKAAAWGAGADTRSALSVGLPGRGRRVPGLPQGPRRPLLRGRRKGPQAARSTGTGSRRARRSTRGR